MVARRNPKANQLVLKKPVGENLSTMNLEELQTLLNTVLEQEDYIRAISIRDEINKRK